MAVCFQFGTGDVFVVVRVRDSFDLRATGLRGTDGRAVGHCAADDDRVAGGVGSVERLVVSPVRCDVVAAGTNGVHRAGAGVHVFRAAGLVLAEQYRPAVGVRVRRRQASDGIDGDNGRVGGDADLVVATDAVGLHVSFVIG